MRVITINNPVCRFQRDLDIYRNTIHGYPTWLGNQSGDPSLTSNILRHGRNQFPVDHVVFKGRFLLGLIDFLDRKVERLTILYTEKMKHPQKEEIRFIRGVRACLCDFTKGLEKGWRYEKPLLTLLEYDIRVSDIPECYKDSYKSTIITQKKNLKEMLSMRSCDKGMVRQNICLLAQLLVTGRAGTSKKLRLPDGCGKNVRFLIEAMGHVVNRSYEEEGAPISILFQIYLESFPRESYRFFDINSNVDLRMGCRALSFLDFVLHSAPIHKEISLMMRA